MAYRFLSDQPKVWLVNTHQKSDQESEKETKNICCIFCKIFRKIWQTSQTFHNLLQSWVSEPPFVGNGNYNFVFKELENHGRIWPPQRSHTSIWCSNCICSTPQPRVCFWSKYVLTQRSLIIEHTHKTAVDYLVVDELIACDPERRKIGDIEFNSANAIRIIRELMWFMSLH